MKVPEALEEDYCNTFNATEIGIQAEIIWARKSVLTSVVFMAVYLVCDVAFFSSQTDWSCTPPLQPDTVTWRLPKRLGFRCSHDLYLDRYGRLCHLCGPSLSIVFFADSFGHQGGGQGGSYPIRSQATGEGWIAVLGDTKFPSHTREQEGWRSISSVEWTALSMGEGKDLFS
jgi:hypothetical protein